RLTNRLSSRRFFAHGTGEHTLDKTLRAQSGGVIGIEVRSTLRAIGHGARVPTILCLSPISRNLDRCNSLLVAGDGSLPAPDRSKKEINMNRSTTPKPFTAIAAFALALAQSANAEDKGCTNTPLRGTYAYTGPGTAVAPPQIAGPVAEVGTQTF